MPEADYSYAYVRPSVLEVADRRLVLQTWGGHVLDAPAAHPRFFTGFLAEPGPAAAGLLAVATVARDRYFRAAARSIPDPVVTCSGDRLRFESFSGCGGVYARLDVLPDALDGEVHGRGTTNVDVNEPLRRALSRVGGRDPLHLAVGPDELAVTTLDGRAVEKKVKMPARWLRGFAEAQVIMAGCDLRAELGVTEAARFLRSLPGGSMAQGVRATGGQWKGVRWVVPSGGSLRVADSPAAGAVCLAGGHRLAALGPLLRFVRGLRAYGPPVTPRSLPSPSAWELDLPGMRLVIALSPETYRGFSGEGAVLDALAAPGEAGDADLVGALLAYEPRVEVGLLAERSGLPPERVRRAVVQLGTAGRVGYDLAEAAHFHRELPYDSALIERDNPRLRDARRLVAAGAVVLVGETATVTATVTARDRTRHVRFAADGTASCSCDWWLEFQGGRGPCKHVLAVRIARGEPAAPERRAVRPQHGGR